MTKARDLANIISGGFTVDDIPDIPASKITSGSIADARLPATALNSNVDLTNLSASNLTSGTIPTARISALPAGVGGKVLQVVQTVKLDIFSTTNNYSNFTDITGFSVAITPSSSSNKILIVAQISGSVTGTTQFFNLLRGSTTIFQPSSGSFKSTVAADGMNTPHVTISFLDSPSTTSATTYKVQTAAQGGTCYVNRRNDSDTHTFTSSITAMEVST